MKNAITLRFLAEALGTFGLVFFAAGSVMVDSIAQGALTLIGLALCSGIAVMTMIYTFGPISGAHINPAVTFGFALTGHLPWKDAGVYVIAQIIGAVIASLLLRTIFGLVAAREIFRITIYSTNCRRPVKKSKILTISSWKCGRSVVRRRLFCWGRFC